MLKDIVPQKCGIVNVSWDPPPDESESRPVASYEAEVGLDNYTWNNCIKTSEKRSCQFRGLLKTRKYPVRVRALNPQGPSNWSKGFISLNASGTLKNNSNMEKKSTLNHYIENDSFNTLWLIDLPRSDRISSYRLKYPNIISLSIYQVCCLDLS